MIEDKDFSLDNSNSNSNSNDIILKGNLNTTCKIISFK